MAGRGYRAGVTNGAIMIRPMLPADAETVAGLVVAAFAVQPAEVDPRPSALGISSAAVAAHLERGGGAVAEQEGEVATEVMGAVLWEAKDGGLYVSRLSVLPENRGRGVARLLMAAAEREAVRLGMARMHLGTRLALGGNRRLFAACGFHEVAFHAHPGYAAPTWVEMEKSLT